MSIKKLVPSSQLRARRGSNGKLPKNGTPTSTAILLAPPVFAGNMAVSVCRDNRKSVSFKRHQTIILQHIHLHMIHHIFGSYNNIRELLSLNPVKTEIFRDFVSGPQMSISCSLNHFLPSFPHHQVLNSALETGRLIFRKPKLENIQHGNTVKR